LVTAEVERINAAQKSTASVLVKSFCGLLTDFATEQGATSILRGLRAVSDFEYEFQMVGMNRQLNSEIETVFLMADAQRQSISSNFIRDIARLNGEISNFTTDYVSGKLKQKFKN
jgi:pantetheine-phosphate adenylyltransferase